MSFYYMRPIGFKKMGIELLCNKGSTNLLTSNQHHVIKVHLHDIY